MSGVVQVVEWPVTSRGEHRERKSNGGGGGSDVEARLATLETHVRHIAQENSEIRLDIRDIRHILMRMMQIGVACAAFLLTGGAVAYVKLSDRIDTLAAQTTTQFNLVDTRFNQVNARLDQMNTALNARMDEIHVRMDRTNERIDQLGDKIDALAGARRARTPAQ